MPVSSLSVDSPFHFLFLFVFFFSFVRLKKLTVSFVFLSLCNFHHHLPIFQMNNSWNPIGSVFIRLFFFCRFLSIWESTMISYRKIKWYTKNENENLYGPPFPEKSHSTFHSFHSSHAFGVWITKFQLDDQRFDIHFVCIRVSSCMHDSKSIEYFLNVPLLLMHAKKYAQHCNDQKFDEEKQARYSMGKKKHMFATIIASTQKCVIRANTQALVYRHFSLIQHFHRFFATVFIEFFFLLFYSAILMSGKFVSLAFGTYIVRSNV